MVRKSWKESYELKNFDQKFYFSDHYDPTVNKYKEIIKILGK